MPSIAESAGAPRQLAAGLAAGVNTISEDQAITFTQYVRMVLPLDGYVFWVKSGVAANTTLKTVTVQGSLHYASGVNQDEDATAVTNAVVFTAQSEIQDFQEINPSTIYIASVDGMRFTFNERKPFYQQSGLSHYRGNAVYSVMDSQILDAAPLDTSLVVSNSLPVWLAMDALMPIYPAYLVPQNLPPPYAAVHILPETTQALGSAPRIDIMSTHTQLVSETVRITIYGTRNNEALDYQDYIFQQSLDTDNFGVMNTPVIRDEKRIQSELSVLAMKKTFTIDISYYQSRMQTLARQLITRAFVTTVVE
jgi:hypothetical protein